MTVVIGTSAVSLAKSYGADEIVDYQKSESMPLDAQADLIINASNHGKAAGSGVSR